MQRGIRKKPINYLSLDFTPHRGAACDGAIRSLCKRIAQRARNCPICPPKPGRFGAELLLDGRAIRPSPLRTLPGAMGACRAQDRSS
jgi:hypothetical protein